MIPAQAFVRLEIKGVEDPTSRFRIRGFCRLCAGRVFEALVDVEKAKAVGITLSDIAAYYAGEHQQATVDHLRAHGIRVQTGGMA